MSEQNITTKLHVVYAHINKINNKVYVGQTSLKPETRWGNNGSNYNKQTIFSHAIEKYGWDNFEHIILERNIPTDKIVDRENYWINYYHSLDPKYGYNMVEAGYKPKKSINYKKIDYKKSWDEKRKKQASENMKKRWRENTDYTNKMRANAKELLDRVRKKDLKGKNNPMYGTHRTGKNAARRKSVQCINTGQIFNTVKDAAEWLGSIYQKTHISEVCKGKRKTAGTHPVTKEKLTWRYIEYEY